MRKIFSFIMVASLMLWSSFSFAAEHGGAAHKEHGGTAAGKEHTAAAMRVPSADEIRGAMKNHVMAQSEATGTFDVLDPETGKTRQLELIRVHERVGKTGNYYYSCADFKDTESGEMLDLDLDVQDKSGQLNVVDVRIHKLEGKERYTYDDNDNRIPIETDDMEDQEHGDHDHAQEHGGKEHGGK